jgi:Sigma-70, region 4/Phage integrase family
VIQIVRPIMLQAGVGEDRAHSHTLRHTFGRLYMAAPGAELSRLRRIMGHASPQTTSRYVHYDVDELGVEHRRIDRLQTDPLARHQQRRRERAEPKWPARYATRYCAAARRPPSSEVFEAELPSPGRGEFSAREILEAIASVPAVYRDALIAVDLLGLSYRKAAHYLQTREATITTRLHRGRQQVVRALG